MGNFLPGWFVQELKSRKGGKAERRKKVEKVDLVMQLAFWQTCQNANVKHVMHDKSLAAELEVDKKGLGAGSRQRNARTSHLAHSQNIRTSIYYARRIKSI